MAPRRQVERPAAAPPAAADPEFDAVLRAVLDLIHKEHPLRANQILELACELQRLGVHRLVEEHLARAERAAGR